ncbi:hypothetical protein GCM10011579_082360 [Streptomyces albiflavescens]|uniref:Uncharacterized protein n=1 Tax=Streptomyces albiflavescens TaxID=1623582 RepID=A0A917YD72_9ACTN|nr:hypothetical protein GCM10011579_082360 [Streptomyces albiflavescens]
MGAGTYFHGSTPRTPRNPAARRAPSGCAHGFRGGAPLWKTRGPLSYPSGTLPAWTSSSGGHSPRSSPESRSNPRSDNIHVVAHCPGPLGEGEKCAGQLA